MRERDFVITEECFAIFIGIIVIRSIVPPH
jgi:hypothetical protein